MIDMDPNTAGDQQGYQVMIDGIHVLFPNTLGWAQSAVTLMVPLADIPTSPNVVASVDWPVNEGQQVEFRAFCAG